jgi:phage gp29-like protein
MCFWPLAFKKGGLKFWLAFAEKFGSAFSIGKLPRNATKEERAELLDGLDDLIQNGVATIPNDGSVELLEMAGKSASADLYERLVMHCRGEITIALLGQNQTTEASANRASATAGLEVTHELRDADGKLAAETVNTLIEWFCELNFGSAQVPQFSLWDQAAQDTLQAARDKSNHEAGANFTNAYWMRAYGYQEGDLQAATAAPAPGTMPGKPATTKALGQDPTEPDADGQNKDGSSTAFAEGAAQADPTAPITSQLMRATAPQWTGFVQQLQSLVDDASDMATLQQNIVQAYGQLDASELVKLMAAAMALAELKGIDAVLTERAAQG